MRNGYEHVSCVLSYGYKRLCLEEIELLIRFSDVMILGRMKGVRNINEGECHGGHVRKALLCRQFMLPVIILHHISQYKTNLFQVQSMSSTWGGGNSMLFIWKNKKKWQKVVHNDLLGTSVYSLL